MEHWFSDTTPAPLAPPPVDALGRFEPLRRAERILLRACWAGDIAKIGLQRPGAPEPTVTVRGSFLSFLARGGSPEFPVAPRRIQVVGAWIEGVLDLGDAEVRSALWFFRCVFDRPLLLDGARVHGPVSLPGCRLPGLLGDRLAVAGDLAINAGCKIRGELRLTRARVAGDLRLDRLVLLPARDAPTQRTALQADFLRVDGDMLLGGGFDAHGEVRALGARIGGSFDASGAKFTASVDSRGARRVALGLDGAQVEGDLKLAAGFSAAGAVRLRRVRVGGDVDCSAAAFDVAGDAAWTEGHVLMLERAEIGGTLELRRLPGPLMGANLEQAQADALSDDDTTWGERIALDGFRYRRLAPGAPLDAPFRLRWLQRQPPEHLRTDWRDAPWTHLAAVLRAAGEARAASTLAIAHETARRRAGRVGRGLPPPLAALASATHAADGWLTGHGHRPGRLLLALALAWLAGTALYAVADLHGQIAGSAGFVPAVHAADRLVPGLEFGPPGRFVPVDAAQAGCIDTFAAAPCARLGAVVADALLPPVGWLGLFGFAAALLRKPRRRA
jgi:hypothetical protein